jgi:hypothetical protein
MFSGFLNQLMVDQMIFHTLLGKSVLEIFSPRPDA